MIKYEYQFTVSATPQEVFDLFTNPTKDVEWRGSAVSAEWTSVPPHGVGSTIKSLDKLLGREVASTQEVTAWDSPNQYGIKGASGPMSFELTLTLEAHDNGTKATMTVEAESGGFFKIAENLFAKQLKKQVTADMDGLKRYLES
tara:strand:- start:200 stop:631 length:432 start_codon:yes stop_codon:yes gene_type:complete